MTTADKSANVEEADPKGSVSLNAKHSIEVQEHGETYTIDPAAERRLVWKFDLRILPLLAVS